MSQTYGNKRVTHDGPCPSCRAQGKDRTGNHLMFFENDKGEKWGYCNRCGHHEQDQEALASYVRKERRELTPEELSSALEEVLECPIQPLTSRGVNRDVAERYGVRVGLSCTDGTTQVSHYYPQTLEGDLRGFRVRNLEHKSFFAVGSGKGCDFFGIDQALGENVSTHTLYVFEDELSAMSGYQALMKFNTNPQYKHISPACVALPYGSKSAGRAFAQNREFVDRFREIVVCMDADEEGNKAARIIQSIHPDAKVVRLSMKDANDLLMAGREKELYQALRFGAKQETPDCAVSIADCIDEALKKPEWGLSYPWPELTKMTYGIRYGEIVAIGGGVGTGKSLVGHELAAHLTKVEGQKVGMFMLEETLGNTIKNVCGKIDHVPYHKPDAEYDEERFRETAMSLNDSLFLWRNFGQNNWDNIKQCIRYWVVSEGVKFIVLDNITCMVSHLSPSEINTEIGRLASELAGLCNELEFTCFIFSHLNPPRNGKPHEEGGEVQEVQFTGSRNLMRYSQVILGFERNKQGEGHEKNISKIRLLKDRNYGQTGFMHCEYIPETGKMNEYHPPEGEADLEAQADKILEEAGGAPEDRPF